MADAIHRDLLTDRLAFDELGWRDLWAYVTAAPPGTAIFHKRGNGFTAADDLAFETLNEMRELVWRYRAMHFIGGIDAPFPERITRSTLTSAPPPPTVTWATVTLDELVSPEVRALLQGE